MDLNKYKQQIEQNESKGLPPVEKWDPPFCGDINMEIAIDGRWYYESSPIGREALVKLFSSVLKKEHDKYYLVTPVEKVGIRVADVPFVFVDWEIINDDLVLTTQTKDRVSLTSEDQLELRTPPAELAEHDPSAIPYIKVRRNLWGRLNQAAYYRLIDFAHAVEQSDGTTSLMVQSHNVNFCVGVLE